MRRFKNLKKTAIHQIKAIVQQRINSRPIRVVVELTNKCNLNCPFCLVGQQNNQVSVAHSELVRESGYLDSILAEKIIKDAKQFGINEILLTFQGEPLLHKQLTKFVRLSKKNDLKTIIFTNGLLLNKDLANKLIESGIDVIRFSVDGASESTYQKNRVGGRFSKVFENMTEVAKIVEENNTHTQLIWQFIALKNNEHEIETAKKMAENIGLEFQVKTFAESVPELTPDTAQYRRKLLPKPCKDLYRAIWIYWNGDVVPCCYDLSGSVILGNVSKNTIEEIWHSKKYVNFRRQVAQSKKYPASEPKLCENCLKWR